MRNIGNQPRPTDLGVELGDSEPFESLAQLFSDATFDKIKGTLGLETIDKSLQSRIIKSVIEFAFLHRTRGPKQPPTVNRRLDNIGKHARALRDELRLMPGAVAQCMREHGTDESKIQKFKASMFIAEAFLAANIEMDDIGRLATALDRTAAVADGHHAKTRKLTLWNQLMSKMADLFEEATGKQAKANWNPHRTPGGKKYIGKFVSFAEIIDAAAQQSIGEDATSNSTLGPRLIQLIKRRKSASQATQ
jgi:hypothetical protein